MDFSNFVVGTLETDTYLRRLNKPSIIGKNVPLKDNHAQGIIILKFSPRAGVKGELPIVQLLFFAFLASLSPTLGLTADRFDHWCEDLFGNESGATNEVCIGNPALIKDLGKSEASLSSFLNTSLLAHVLRCQKIRDQGGPIAGFAIRTCQFQSPIYGVAKDLRFLSHQDKPPAELPSSGARLVADCEGRHIQVWGDLPEAKQKTVLKNLFDKISATNLDPGIKFIQANSSGGGKVEAKSCPIEMSEPILPKKFYPSVWVLTSTGVKQMEVADIPLEYVSPKCREKAGFKVIVPTQKSKTTNNSSLKTYKTLKSEVRLADNECQYTCIIDGSSSYNCTKCKQNVERLKEDLGKLEE